MKLLILLLSFSFISINIVAQTQGIAYPQVGKGVATTFVNDYHSLGVNSSALGWGTGYKDKRVTMGLAEFGFGIYSDSLNSDKLKNFYKAVKGEILNSDSDSIDWKAQQAAAADYAGSKISMFVNYNWGGFAFQNDKFGGIAINIRENYQWYSKFNNQITDLVFKGKLSNYFDSLTIVVAGDTSVIANSSTLSSDTLNSVILGTASVPLRLSELTDGSEIRSVWNRFYNFGYGRKILGKDSVFVLYGGIGGRFIQSMAMFNMESKDGELYMYSSISPNFNIDYGNVATINPSTFVEKGKLLPKTVGNGYGIDLSLSAILFNKLKIAAAVNNIGSVTYTRNVYRVSDTLSLTSMSISGLSDYNISQSVNKFLDEGGLFELQGQEEYVLKNASDFRFGASMDFGKAIKLGVDFVAPLNRDNPGSIANPIVSVGGEVRLKFIVLSAGYFGGGIYKNNIPVGINFVLGDGSYEIGISSYDAISFFSKKSNSISAAFGFARFRF